MSPSIATEQPKPSIAAASLAATFTRSEKSSLSRRFLPASLPRRIARASSRPHAWGAAAARQIKANACIVGLPDASSTRAGRGRGSGSGLGLVRWPVAGRDARKHTRSRYDGARVRADARATRWRRDARASAPPRAASRRSRRRPAAGRRVVVHAARPGRRVPPQVVHQREARRPPRATGRTRRPGRRSRRPRRRAPTPRLFACLCVPRANRARRRHSSIFTPKRASS